MSAKAKYEKIDQSKLSENVRKLLEQMKEKTNNFEDEEAVKKAKVEEALDKLIDKFPEIVKTAPKTRTVSQKKVSKKAPKKAKKSTSSTGGAKRETVMTVAQRIRKKDESWNDALSRAKAEMGKQTQKKVSALKNELDKLKELLKNDSVLKDFGKSDLERDSVRKALPKGKRVTKNKGKTTNQYGTFKNKVGKVYYENRENRSDRYSPSFPKDKPFLEEGGELMAMTEDMQQLGIANADFSVMAKGGTLDAHGLQEGDVIVRNILDFQEVKTKNGDIVYVDLENGYRGELPPLPFAKGGRLKSALMRDRKYFNKNESWERAYSKGKNRRGYKENGGTIENSIQSYQNHYKGFPSYAKGGEISSSDLSKWDNLLDYGEDVVVYDKKGVKYIYQGSTFEKDGVAVMKGFDESTYKILDLDEIDSIEIGNIYAKGGEITVEIVDNFDEHIGYEKGTPLNVVEVDEDDYMITSDGRFLSAGEVEFADQKSEDNYYKIINSRFAKGGEIDLFEDYESQPKNLSEIVEKYEERYLDGDMNYEDTKKFLKEVNAIGYTFDYGLDNEPYDLRKMSKGGRLKSTLMRDRKYYNKNEAWERAYSKGKNRRGYKEDGGTIADSTQHFRIMETDTPIYKEGGQIDMDL